MNAVLPSALVCYLLLIKVLVRSTLRTSRLPILPLSIILASTLLKILVRSTYMIRTSYVLILFTFNAEVICRKRDNNQKTRETGFTYEQRFSSRQPNSHSFSPFFPCPTPSSPPPHTPKTPSTPATPLLPPKSLSPTSPPLVRSK